MQGRYNVLFLCTGNSARSIMAEAIMNHRGRPNFTAYSAGSHPSGKVRPEALKLLQDARLPTEKLRGKNWEEFAKPGSQRDLPSLAGSANDSALGRSRSCRSGGYTRANRTGFSRRIHDSRTENLSLPVPPPFQPRQVRN